MPNGLLRHPLVEPVRLDAPWGERDGAPHGVQAALQRDREEEPPVCERVTVTLDLVFASSRDEASILLRSVKRDGGAITDALTAAGVPYVITGMDNLFAKPEAEAARQLFYFLAGSIDEAALTLAWETADLGIHSGALAKAVANAARARKDMADAEVGQFKVYNLQRQFMAFLETIELREELVPDGRGEVVFYNLGKFSQAISDFESIHFHSNPTDK